VRRQTVVAHTWKSHALRFGFDLLKPDLKHPGCLHPERHSPSLRPLPCDSRNPRSFSAALRSEYDRDERHALDAYACAWESGSVSAKDELLVPLVWHLSWTKAGLFGCCFHSDSASCLTPPV
jgi:hypothetical protein